MATLRFTVRPYLHGRSARTESPTPLWAARCGAGVAVYNLADVTASGTCGGELGEGKILGVKPTTLESRVKKLGIQRES